MEKKTTILNTEQKLVFNEISNYDFVKNTFYFTSGTALSEIYYQHRESVDLDFFSDAKFESQLVYNVITGVAQKLDVSFESQHKDPLYIYHLKFKDRNLKLDFARYPYKRLEEGPLFNGLKVDSKLDIAVNKTLVIGSQRTEVKDYVDLNFFQKCIKI